MECGTLVLDLQSGEDYFGPVCLVQQIGLKDSFHLSYSLDLFIIPCIHGLEKMIRFLLAYCIKACNGRFIVLLKLTVSVQAFYLQAL